MVMPPEDNPDDVLASMESQFADTLEPDVENMQKLSDYELSNRFNDARDHLLQMGEMDNQHSDAGRGWQSVRAACLIEMTRRGMR